MDIDTTYLPSHRLLTTAELFRRACGHRLRSMAGAFEEAGREIEGLTGWIPDSGCTLRPQIEGRDFPSRVTDLVADWGAIVSAQRSLNRLAERQQTDAFERLIALEAPIAQTLHRHLPLGQSDLVAAGLERAWAMNTGGRNVRHWGTVCAVDPTEAEVAFTRVRREDRFGHSCVRGFVVAPAADIGPVPADLTR